MAPAFKRTHSIVDDDSIDVDFMGRSIKITDAKGRLTELRFEFSEKAWDKFLAAVMMQHARQPK